MDFFATCSNMRKKKVEEEIIIKYALWFSTMTPKSYFEPNHRTNMNEYSVFAPAYEAFSQAEKLFWNNKKLLPRPPFQSHHVWNAFCRSRFVPRNVRLSVIPPPPPTISNSGRARKKSFIFFSSFNFRLRWLRGRKKKEKSGWTMGCMQVMFLVICSRLLAFYGAAKAVCEWGMLCLEGRRKKNRSHPHHNSNIFLHCNNSREIFFNGWHCGFLMLSTTVTVSLAWKSCHSEVVLNAYIKFTHLWWHWKKENKILPNELSWVVFS